MSNQLHLQTVRQYTEIQCATLLSELQSIWKHNHYHLKLSLLKAGHMLFTVRDQQLEVVTTVVRDSLKHVVLSCCSSCLVTCWLSLNSKISWLQLECEMIIWGYGIAKEVACHWIIRWNMLTLISFAHVVQGTAVTVSRFSTQIWHPIQAWSFHLTLLQPAHSLGSLMFPDCNCYNCWQAQGWWCDWENNTSCQCICMHQANKIQAPAAKHTQSWS